MTALDLSIFDQATWHLSRLQEPGSTIKGLDNLWGDHFHPILILLAPLYWLWSDARVLLIAQALLVSASVVPVFLFARSRLGRPGAYLLAGAYGTFWGLQSGLSFDFHEVAFAPLLIALAILFLDQRRWRAYFVSIVLLLCVKEDLAILVSFFGVLLLTQRELRWGLVTLVVGIAWYRLATKLVIAPLSPTGRYPYWSYTQLGKDLPHAIWTILHSPWRPFEIALDTPEKARTLLYLFLPFLGLTLCSRLALLALPLLAERFLSTTPAYWGTGFHYSMTIAPVLAMGAAAGLHNLGRLLPARAGPIVATGAAAVMLALGPVLTAATQGTSVQSSVLHASFYRAPPFAAALHHALAKVPSGASVATDDFLAPHLAHRQQITEIGAGQGRPQYVVAGLFYLVGSPGANIDFHGVQQALARLLPSYYAVFYQDGWVVLERRPHDGSGRAPPGALTPMSPSESQRVLVSATGWGQALGRLGTGLIGCAALRLRGTSGAPRCFADLGADFARHNLSLATELASLVAQLRGGCQQLAAVAIGDDAQLSRDLERARRAGQSGTVLAYARSFVQLRSDNADADLSGAVGRFYQLCSPS